jgi:predicted aspartyl protease
MKFPYNSDYEPSFPSIRVMLRNEQDALSTTVLEALLDTGSDGTLVPIRYLQEILAPAITDTHIRSHWGEWRTAQLFVVDIELNANLRLPSIFVVGDEQGDELVLGRNVLNKLRIFLDGPANITDVPQQ